jgi:hypothetical protein
MKAETHFLGIEAPLLRVQALGVDKVARFVNLTYSMVDVRYFDVDDGWDSVTTTWKDVIKAWVRNAARECSNANLQAEITVLDQLKKKGSK